MNGLKLEMVKSIFRAKDDRYDGNIKLYYFQFGFTLYLYKVRSMNEGLGEFEMYFIAFKFIFVRWLLLLNIILKIVN